MAKKRKNCGKNKKMDKKEKLLEKYIIKKVKDLNKF